MKYVVAYVNNEVIYYMDNKLYNYKKQAYTRLKKLNEDGERKLKVYLISSLVVEEVTE